MGRLTYFLEQQDILSPVQAGFIPGGSTVDQVLLLSQSIADSFHQSKPGARAVLAAVDFVKAFGSVWRSAFLSGLLSLNLPLCFVEWMRYCLSDRRSKVRICNSCGRPFRLRGGVPRGSVLGPVLFSLYINGLPAFLPASVETSLCADGLAIWASSPSVGCATYVVQAALGGLVEWSSGWRLPLGPLRCGASFFSLDPCQLRVQPSLHILDTPLKFNPHPTFLGVAFDRTLSFGYHVLSLRKGFCSRFRAFRSVASASWGPSKESLCTLYKAFICPILTYASPGWFPFSSPARVASVERMRGSSCGVVAGCLSSAPVPLLHVEALLPPLRVALARRSLSFFERALRLPPTFPIASLANSNPRARLGGSSWGSVSGSHGLAPGLHLARGPLVLCHPGPPWFAPSRCTVSLRLSSPCSRGDPLSLRNAAAATHLSTLSCGGVSAWTGGSVPGGLGRGGAGSASGVQGVSLLPRPPFRLVSGLPVVVRGPSLSCMLLGGVSLTPRHVILNLSPSFPTLYLSYQLSMLPYHT